MIKLKAEVVKEKRERENGTGVGDKRREHSKRKSRGIEKGIDEYSVAIETVTLSLSLPGRKDPNESLRPTFIERI